MISRVIIFYGSPNLWHVMHLAEVPSDISPKYLIRPWTRTIAARLSIQHLSGALAVVIGTLSLLYGLGATSPAVQGLISACAFYVMWLWRISINISPRVGAFKITREQLCGNGVVVIAHYGPNPPSRASVREQIPEPIEYECHDISALARRKAP